MKLLTHNMLQCHIKGVQNGYPLKVEAEKVRRGGEVLACHSLVATVCSQWRWPSSLAVLVDDQQSRVLSHLLGRRAVVDHAGCRLAHNTCAIEAQGCASA
jgi:hypothetical protein